MREPVAGLGPSSVSLSPSYLTPAMASPHWPLAFRFLYLKSRARAPGADYSQHSCDREGRQPQTVPPTCPIPEGMADTQLPGPHLPRTLPLHPPGHSFPPRQEEVGLQATWQLAQPLLE